MGKITLKAYAVKHKMSMFQVVKLVKSSQLKSETVEEEGGNVVYIIEEKERIHNVIDGSKKRESEQDEPLAVRVSALENELALLRKEFDALKSKV